MEATTDTTTPLGEQMLNVRHDVGDGIGLPYGEAGVAHVGPKRLARATVTCPVCGNVSAGGTPKMAGVAYALHFDQRAKLEARHERGEGYPIMLLGGSYTWDGGECHADHLLNLPTSTEVTEVYAPGTVLLAFGPVITERIGGGAPDDFYTVPWADGTVRVVRASTAARVA